MSVLVTATAAGSPSSVATRAGPCDSPAVSQRSGPECTRQVSQTRVEEPWLYSSEGLEFALGQRVSAAGVRDRDLAVPDLRHHVAGHRAGAGLHCVRLAVDLDVRAATLDRQNLHGLTGCRC